MGKNDLALATCFFVQTAINKTVHALIKPLEQKHQSVQTPRIMVCARMPASERKQKQAIPNPGCERRTLTHPSKHTRSQGAPSIPQLCIGPTLPKDKRFSSGGGSRVPVATARKGQSQRAL